MNQYAVYRSSTNFTEPDTFAPTRWLGDPRFAADKREAFHPFSMGPRNCIAKTYVYRVSGLRSFPAANG